MASYAKYSLVPTDEPDKAKISNQLPNGPKKLDAGGGGGNLLSNILNPTHKPPSSNKSTLPPPPNSAFDYTSAFNFKSAFEYNSATPSHYQSAFDYGYSNKENADATAAAGKKGAYSLTFSTSRQSYMSPSSSYPLLNILLFHLAL